MIKVFGIDVTHRTPTSVVINTFDEDQAWDEAKSAGIIPMDMLHLSRPPKPEKPTRGGVIYLLQCGVFYKIGKTTNPKKRYDQLKIQLPEKPILVHEIRTNDVDYTERHWHRRFIAQRANGEWFQLSVDDVAEFVRCKRITLHDE